MQTLLVIFICVEKLLHFYHSIHLMQWWSMQRKMNQMTADQLILRDWSKKIISHHKTHYLFMANWTSWLLFQRVNNRQSYFYVAFKMSRKSFKEVNPFQPTQAGGWRTRKAFEWSLCILRQNITKESLQTPARSKRLDLGACYKSTAKNLQGFFPISALPFDVKQNQLDDGSGLFNTSLKHEASWHKSCKDKINRQKKTRRVTTTESSESKADKLIWH